MLRKFRNIRSDMYDVHFWQEDAPLANWGLCLSTTKHNGKSGTADNQTATWGNVEEQD